MQPLINELLSEGFSVQLEHVPTETSFQDTDAHGYVLLKTATGKIIIRKGGFQHNRNLRSGGSWDAAAVSELCTAVKQAVEAEGASPEKVAASGTEGATVATAA